MAINKSPSGQDGSEVILYINDLIKTIPFDAIVYTYDWHPADHCSFIENVGKKKLALNSPVKIIILNNWKN